MNQLLNILAQAFGGGASQQQQGGNVLGVGTRINDNMNWLKGVDDNFFGLFPQGDLPMRDDIRSFQDFNRNRTTQGMPALDQDYYAQTYLPNEYRYQGNPKGALSDMEVNQLRRNPYLRELYLPKGYF